MLPGGSRGDWNQKMAQCALVTGFAAQAGRIGVGPSVSFNLSFLFSTTMMLDVATAPTVGQVFCRVRPSSTMFTQDSIKNLFQDGHIFLETAPQIAHQDIDKHDIQMIAVLHTRPLETCQLPRLVQLMCR